jgi:hypothetical protein
LKPERKQEPLTRQPLAADTGVGKAGNQDMSSKPNLFINYEKDYYPCIVRWLQDKKGCTSASTEHLFQKSALLSADVVGWIGDEPAYACEMKPYPLPIGSVGYGSIGQALMLKHHARRVYVGGIASERAELSRGQIVHWKKFLQRSSTKSLLRLLNVDVADNYGELLEVAGVVFRTYFGSLGLGFLLVHETNASEDPLLSCEVDEIVEPRAF